MLPPVIAKVQDERRTCNGATFANTSTVPDHEACSVAISQDVVMPLARIEDALQL